MNTNLFYKQLRFCKGAQMYYKQMLSSPHVRDVTTTSQLKGINLSSLLNNSAETHRNAIEGDDVIAACVSGTVTNMATGI